MTIRICCGSESRPTWLWPAKRQLAQMAYQQNIVVTVPAQTRFYIVPNDSGVEARHRDPAAPPPRAVSRLAEQEIRERRPVQERHAGDESALDDDRAKTGAAIRLCASYLAKAGENKRVITIVLGELN